MKRSKNEPDKIAKLQLADSSYFHGKTYFDDYVGTQHYFVFQLLSISNLMTTV